MSQQISQGYRESMSAAFLAPVGLEFDNIVAQINTSIRGIGAWTTVPYSAGLFAGASAMTWTVNQGSVTTFDYAEFGAHGFAGGAVQVIHLHLVNSTVGGTLNTNLKIAVPNSRSILRTCSGVYSFRDNSTYGVGIWEALVNDSTIEFYRQDKTNWSASTGATDIRATLIVGVQ